MQSDTAATTDLLDILRRRRLLFLGIFLASFLAGLILAMVLPPRYRARAILLPPDVHGLPPLTENDRRALAAEDDVGPLEVLETPAGLAARLVGTRPIIERALASLKPGSGWPPGEEERLRRVLTDGARSWVTDELVVFIEVEAEDAATCAAAANALGRALDGWNVARRTDHARAAREAIDAEVSAVQAEMRALSDSLAVLRPATGRRGEQAEVMVDPLVGEKGAVGEIARRIVLRRGELWSLGAERAERRAAEVDPRPAIEFVEDAVPPAHPTRPLRPAVVLLVVMAGFLGAAAVAVLADALESRRSSRGSP